MKTSPSSFNTNLIICVLSMEENKSWLISILHTTMAWLLAVLTNHFSKLEESVLEGKKNPGAR